MQLINVNKSRYRKHLNIVIVIAIVFFAATSLGIAQFLIALMPDPDGSHFHWNLLGVILSGLAVGMLFNSYKNHHFMTEVYYVWKLKQVLNKITRKMTRIKTAAENGDASAMQIMQYSYSGSRLLWELDDNSIVMEELTIKQAELDVLAKQHNVILDAAVFDVQLLSAY